MLLILFHHIYDISCSADANYNTVCVYISVTNNLILCDIGDDGSGGGSDDWNIFFPGGGNSSSVPATIITPDTGITNHDNVNCVYQKLVNGVFKDVLSSFLGNQYNITFTIGTLAGGKEGNTRLISGTI